MSRAGVLWSRIFYIATRFNKMVHTTSSGNAIKTLHEAAEFAAEPSLEEAADVILCVVSWALTEGYRSEELLAAVVDKGERCLLRTWKQQSDGTFQHVREVPLP